MRRTRPRRSAACLLAPLLLGAPLGAAPLASLGAQAADTLGPLARLKAQGWGVRLGVTQLFQGLATGSGARPDWESGTLFDAVLDVNAERAFGWTGGGITTHVQAAGGRSRLYRGRNPWPVNIAMYEPTLADGAPIVTSLYASQRLGARGSVMVGKFNAFDLLAADPYLGGAGVTRWMSNGLAAPPNGITPAAFVGAIGSLRTRGGVTWTVILYDPQNAWSTSGLGSLFGNGVALSTSATIRGGGTRPATHTLTAIVSNREGVDFRASQFTPPPGPLVLSRKRGTYNVSYAYGRDLRRSTTDPRDHLGVFFKGALADGNPNTLQASVTAGLAGTPRGRPEDGFGIGYYYLGTSDAVEDALRPLLGVRNTHGVEAWYRVQQSRLAFTPDLQVVRPLVGGAKLATLVGLRIAVQY